MKDHLVVIGSVVVGVALGLISSDYSHTRPCTLLVGAFLFTK